MKKVLAVVLSIVLLVMVIPASTSVGATSYKGGDYTTNTRLAYVLDSIFKGDIDIYSNSNYTNEVFMPVGFSMNKNINYYVRSNTTGNRCIGKQCYIYANAVYNKLFNEWVGHGSSFSHSQVVISGGSKTASYNMFSSAGVKCGAYMRTTNYSSGAYNGGAGHSLIILSYNQNHITYLEGNADGKGLVKITKQTWSEFNAGELSGRARYISHVAQPTASKYKELYPSNSSPTPSPTPSPSGSVNPDNYPYPSRTLKYTSPTMKGNDVKWVQAVLCRLGYSVDIDGSYGKNSVAAIKRFQTDYKLTVDGYCGPATRAKLLELWNAKKHIHTYGESYEAAHPHRIYKKCSCGDWYYTGGTKKLSSCSSCYPKPCGHSYDNLCDGICNLCGAYRSVSHSYSRRITKQATCATEGVLTNICIKCSYSYTSKIPATGAHTWKNGTCSVCKKTSTPVKITSQPKTAYACYGKKATITIAAKGDGLTYNWYIKNASNKKYYKSSIKGNSYSQKLTDKTNGRRVLCIVTDKYGNKVQSKTVLMRMKATITSQPKSATVANGKIAKIKVGAKGDGLKYTWYIKNARGTKYIKSSIKTSTYSVRMTSAVNGRRLLCYVTDKYGNKVQTRTVILKKK